MPESRLNDPATDRYSPRNERTACAIEARGTANARNRKYAKSRSFTSRGDETKKDRETIRSVGDFRILPARKGIGLRSLLNRLSLASTRSYSRRKRFGELACHPRDAVVGLGEFFRSRLIAKLHQIGVFGCVVVEITQNRDRFEAEVLEEQLCFEVRFANFKHDSVASFVRQFTEQFLHHHIAHALATVVAVNGKVQNVKAIFVQFVDHKTDDFSVAFGDHADAISLPEAADEIILGPWELETITFDAQYIWHISTDHPANVRGFASLFSLFHVGLPSGAMKIS